MSLSHDGQREYEPIPGASATLHATCFARERAEESLPQTGELVMWTRLLLRGIPGS